MNAPKNCRECEHASRCRSWYGGTACKHLLAIIRKITKKEE